MPDRPPNVVVFFTDQQRWDTAGCYGCPMDLTPNLDAMARRGVIFENAFTCQPVCGPARASLQTGLYASATGCFRNGVALPADLPTLAKCFNAAGYQTAYIGKWHLSDKGPGPVPQELRGGYRVWLASNVLEFTSHPYDGCVFNNDNKSVRLRGYRVDALTDLAIEFLRRERTSPFFLFISYLEPHFQNDMVHFVAPDGYAEKYRHCHVPADLLGHPGDWAEELPDYYGIVARLDECLGRLLGALTATGQAENTIVLFTSDHGCHFRTRNSEYKRSCHESSIRIPLVIDGPGFRGGAKVPQLVSLVDVPPTILSACALAIPPMHGRDMVPLVRGDARDWKDEVFIEISESQVGRAIRTGRWKYSAAAPDKHGGRDPRGELYVDECLYDLQSDPHEQTNLIGREEYRDVLDDLRRRLAARVVAAGEPQPKVLPRPGR